MSQLPLSEEILPFSALFGLATAPPLVWPLPAGCTSSPLLASDERALVEHLQAPQIAQATIYLPWPLTPRQAKAWLRGRLSAWRELGLPTHLAIRDEAGRLVGTVGAEGRGPNHWHRAELGYWLAVPYWGQGIMTAAVGAYVEYAFSQLRLVKLTAKVLAGNTASDRVLEKNGFRMEGYLHKHYARGEALLDAKLFGRVAAGVS